MFISRTASIWNALVIIAIALAWSGYSSSTMAQVDLDPRIVKSVRSNPRVDRTSTQRKAIEDAIEAGNKARDNSEFETALASYGKVAEKLAPKDARAFYGLGNVYADLACSDNAIKAYNDALKLKKDFRDAILALANEYANKDRLDEAEARFRSLNAKDVAGRMGLAFILGKRKQYQEAIDKLNLIATSPSIEAKDRAYAHLLLGDIYKEQRKFSEAAVEYKEVIKLNYFLPSAYIRLGQTELFPATTRFSSLIKEERTIEDRGKMIQAAKYAAENIRKAIYEHNYKHPSGYLLLSYALMNQFTYQEAEKSLKTYFTRVDELKTRLPVLANNCDYGFNKLYAMGYLALALTHHQQSSLETDPQKKAQYQEQVLNDARNLLQFQENDASAYTLIGQIYFAKGKYKEAIREFETAIAYETNPRTKAATYELIAVCYSNMERPKDAIAAYEETRKLSPGTSSPLWGLAQLYEKQGDFERAISLKKEAINYEPKASSYWMLASTYLAKARQNNTEADFEEAIKWLKKAIDVNQGFGPAYFLLGQAYKFYKSGIYVDEAIANYEMAAKYNPKDAFIYLQLGDLYYVIKKNHDAAIKYLHDAINLDPNLARAYWELGAIYHERGDYDQAVKYLLEAIRADRSYEDAYFGLITIYRSQKKYAEAIELVHRVFDVAPKAAWAHKELAKIYETQQKNDEAIKYYQQAIGLLKANDTFGKELYGCRIERLRRNYAEAIRCFQNLKPLDTEDPGQQAYDIGLTHVASGNKEAAMAQYEQLKKVGSALVVELISRINEMK